MRWVFHNLSALLFSLALAVTIWIVAVNEEDPFEEKPFPEPISVEIMNLPPGMIVVDATPPAATLQLRAPHSTWTSLSKEQLHVSADLARAESGVITVPLTANVDDRNARITALLPPEIRVTLEQTVTRQVPIRPEVIGDPATGYQTKAPILPLETALVSGPASAAAEVSELIARVEVSGARQTITQKVNLLPVNAAGQIIANLSLEPRSISLTVPVEQLGGYRDVAVKAVIEGRLAPGFRITNISVSPQVVTLFSASPETVAQLPGFVETQPININQFSDDVEVRANLILPAGVSLVSDQPMLVQISIAAIESSLTMQQHELEFEGLAAGLNVTASPGAVDVILSGPLSTLDLLTPESIRVVVNLLNLTPGLYQLAPEVIAPKGVTVQTVLPATIEVLITGPGTSLPTVASTPTATPTATRSPTRRPTFTPTFPATLAPESTIAPEATAIATP